MSARGPKPRPTALKLLEGERPDRVNAAEPRALPGRPACPRHLDETAREEWDRIVPELEELGVLSRTDGAALAIYCDTYSQWVRANRDIRTYGMTVETGMGGLKANPAVAISRAAASLMHRLLSEFGGTPSSRSRLRAATDDGPKDALGEFLARRKLP